MTTPASPAAGTSLKVAIIGAGTVGSSLGHRLQNAGVAVKYGCRAPTSDKIARVLEAQQGATADVVQAAVAWGEVVILATTGSHDDEGIRALAASLGPGVKDKIVLDATNPLSGYPALGARWGNSKSGGEVLAEALPDSHVFKAFNTMCVGGGAIVDPGGGALAGERLTMLYAGPDDDLDRKDTVEEVISAVGFKPEYVGSIRYARNLEALSELQLHLATPGAGSAQAWGPNVHIQVIRKEKGLCSQS